MRPRHGFWMVMIVALAGCADPPGQPKMLPLDYNEQTRAEASFLHAQPELQQIDGVLKSYLTANNNPRRIVVIVSKEAAAAAVRAKYPNGIDGLGIDTQKQFSDTLPDEGIQAVKTVQTPTGWWGQFLFALEHLPLSFWGKKPGG